MAANEYCRSLIMLRSLISGYSGHARLETRVMSGNIYIVATTPQSAGELRAALVGMRRGEYYAVPLGTLRRDMRGQATLSAQIDPRDVNGMPLEDYSFLAIVNTDGPTCELALAGNLFGSAAAEWSSVSAVVCMLYRARDEVTGLEAEQTGESPAETPTETQAETPTEAPEEAPEETPAEAETQPLIEFEFPEDMPPFPEDTYTYVQIPLPEACGYDRAYAASRALEDGAVEHCVAIYAPYSSEPPPGMEDYTWSGGTGAGWWIWCGAGAV